MDNLSNLFENATVGFFQIKLPGAKIIEANASFARILGYQSLKRLFSHFVWSKHFSFTGREKATGSSGLMETGEYREMRIHRTDGSIGWVNLSFELYPKAGILQGIMVDISVRKRLEVEIIDIADMERERFGRDLHDVLGQTLTGTAFLCRALMQRLPADPAGVKEEVGQIENLVNQALDQARHLAHGFVHIEVRPSGIGAQLKKLAAQVHTIFGVTCKADYPSRVVLPNRESAIHLYRIAQEAVYNAVKYSGSPSIEIRLEKKATIGILTVEDFGKGLPKRFSRKKGIGMQSMKLRARLMGASIRFLNKTGHGFQAVCRFPLAKENTG
jgi:two-component system, LuxR family, sensor kinase FixL